jgi:hypothetical protein
MVVVGTRMFTFVPSHVAKGLASTIDICILELRVEIPAIEEFASWQPKLNWDRGHRWRREIMFDGGAGLTSPPVRHPDGPSAAEAAQAMNLSADVGSPPRCRCR